MDGYVYYLYPVNYLRGIQQNYGICISDISNVLLKLLTNQNDKIFIGIDPNQMTINDLQKFEHGLNNIIKQQYFIDNELFLYNGNPTQYDYKNAETLINQYKNSFNYETLLDKNGIFYIVHPNEKELKRNLVGTIMEKPTYDRIEKHFQGLENMELISNKRKSLYGVEIENIYKKLFPLDANGLHYAIALVYSSIYGCLDEMTKIVYALSEGN